MFSEIATAWRRISPRGPGTMCFGSPAAALFRRDKDWMTFTVEDNRAKLTRVAIDHNNGEFAEVKDGLVEGQRVILYPADTIADGVSC